MFIDFQVPSQWAVRQTPSDRRFYTTPESPSFVSLYRDDNSHGPTPVGTGFEPDPFARF